MKIHEIFRSIQGEGSNSGIPTTFIRLYGCNLSCPSCDTPQSGYIEMSVDEVIWKVRGWDDWICITGGEPTIHSDLADLVKNLRVDGHWVSLETNGTNPILDGFHWVVVSPKSFWPTSDVFEKADEIKLLAGSDMYNAQIKIRDNRDTWRKQNKVISVQPWWNEHYYENLLEAIKLSQFYQVRLSVQLHKYLEVK